MRYDINFNPMPNKAHLVVLSEAHLAVLRSFLKKLIATCDFSIRKISKKTVYAVDDDTVSFSHSLVYNETRSDELKAIVFEIVANSHSQTEIIGFLGRGRYGKVKACIGRIVYTRLDLKIEMHNSQSSDRSVLKVQQQRDERWKERVTEEYAFTQQIYSSVRMLYNFA